MTTTDTLLADLADVLDRASKLATEMAATLAACPMHEPGDPDCRPSHGGACRPPVDMLAVDLGAPTGHHPAVATMPVADVPVDGSVEVRPVCGQGRFGPWVHVIGEALHAVGGEQNRSLLIAGITEPFTWHRDQCVQVRPFRPADEDLADAIGRSRCVVGACHPPTEPVRCVFAADYETTPWRCERLAGHEGAHRSGPVAPSER